MVALVTDLHEPLGRYVGNSLEVYEAVLSLMGQGDK
jgi:thymidine phosphorylase